MSAIFRKRLYESYQTHVPKGTSLMYWIDRIDNGDNTDADYMRLLKERDMALQELAEAHAVIDRLKAELAAAPRWVPVDEFKAAFGITYIVMEDGYPCMAYRAKDAWEEPDEYAARMYGVTHVLVTPTPPTD